MENAASDPTLWRKCTTCKKPVAFGQKYWVCSVSTCNRQRTDLLFCSVACFDAHVPVLNHRDAGAFEKRAPNAAEWKRLQDEAAAKTQPGTVPGEKPAGAPRPRAPKTPAEPRDSSNEILVIASKVKDYIRIRSGGMNTSASVMEALSDKVRAYADDAIRRATQSERKTVLDRDIGE